MLGLVRALHKRVACVLWSVCGTFIVLDDYAFPNLSVA